MLSHEDHRELAQRRARLARQTEATKFLLQSVARPDLFEDCCFVDEHNGFDRWIRMLDVTQHADFSSYPLLLEYRTPKGPVSASLHSLWPAIQRTLIGRCVEPEFHPTRSGKGVGVVSPWNGELTVIHNHPQFIELPAIDRLEVEPGVTIAMHWYEPFIAAVGERCRCDMASEEAIIELEEGEWFARDWSDYPEPDLD